MEELRGVHLVTGHLSDRRRCIVRLVPAQLRHRAQAPRPHERHVDCRGKGVQGLVGADVGGRLVASDVLLPGAEREHKAALSILVHGFPRDSSA